MGDYFRSSEVCGKCGKPCVPCSKVENTWLCSTCYEQSNNPMINRPSGRIVDARHREERVDGQNERIRLRGYR